MADFRDGTTDKQNGYGTFPFAKKARMWLKNEGSISKSTT